MLDNDIFQPLPPDQIKEQVDKLKIAYDLIAITLLNGEVLLGALGKHWKWDGKIVTLGFNTEDGKRFGHSHAVDIPIGLIANIQLIPWLKIIFLELRKTTHNSRL